MIFVKVTGFDYGEDVFESFSLDFDSNEFEKVILEEDSADLWVGVDVGKDGKGFFLDEFGSVGGDDEE